MWGLRIVILRPPISSECESLTALCLSSKAYWGYDSAFMEACKDELTLTDTILQTSELIVAEVDGVILGLAQLDVSPPVGVLEKLFVDGGAIGKGVGKHLFLWAVARASELGINQFTLDGDPNAVPFYLHMGAIQIGSSPSGSIPGRLLPKFQYDVVLPD